MAKLTPAGEEHLRKAFKPDPSLAVSLIKEVLADDISYTTDALKIGAIWGICMEWSGLDFRRGEGAIEVQYKKDKKP